MGEINEVKNEQGEVVARIFVANIDDLIPTEDNPRQITKENMKRLENKMKQYPKFIDAREVVIDENNVILGGHQRVNAYKEMGKDKIVVKQVIGWNEDEKANFVIADNHSDGEWDADKLANGRWSDMPLDEWMGDETPKDWIEANEQPIIEDEVPEAPEEAKSERGKIYKLGDHLLMCGDSTDKNDVQALMGDQLADLVLTDPPYNVNYEGGTGLKIENDNKSDADFHDFLVNAFLCMNMAMKSGASFYIWHADSEGYNFRSACREAGWQVRECLIWNKNSLVLGRQDYQWKHEPCLYGWKEGTHQWYADRKQTTVIDMDRPKKSAEHPTMKPVGLFGYQIKNSTKSGDIVLDLFGGSGTTVIACEQLKRRAFTMELDPKYCDVIRKRWYKLVNNDNEDGWEDATPAIN